MHSPNTKYREHASQENWKKGMQIFTTAVCNVTAWRHSKLHAHWLMALVGGPSVSYLSFVYGRSLWAELNGGENSLHWKANMLPLFSIMTLCKYGMPVQSLHNSPGTTVGCGIFDTVIGSRSHTTARFQQCLSTLITSAVTIAIFFFECVYFFWIWIRLVFYA